MNYTPFCAGCWRNFRDKEVTYPSKNKLGFHVYRECSIKEDMLQWIQWSTKPCYLRKENMPNIKITAEVDGKIVPLNTISTESFEAIKALEKQKEIPVARLGTFRGLPSEGRLILKITPNLRRHVAEPGEDILAIDIATGGVAAWWKKESDENRIGGYSSIKPL